MTYNKIRNTIIFKRLHYEGPLKVKGSLFLHPETTFCKAIQSVVEPPKVVCDFKLLESEGRMLHCREK
jgi:hypothetical protein